MTSIQVVNLGQPFRCSGSLLLALKKQNVPKGRQKVEEAESDCAFNQLLDFPHLIAQWFCLLSMNSKFYWVWQEMHPLYRGRSRFSGA